MEDLQIINYQAMKKKNSLQIANCLLSYQGNNTRHACNIQLSHTGLMKIQVKHRTYTQQSQRTLETFDYGIGLNLQVPIKLLHNIYFEQINSYQNQTQQYEISLISKQTKQKIKIYVFTTLYDYDKIFIYFKDKSWVRTFNQYYQLIQKVKLFDQQKKYIQYIQVKQKITQKIKLVRRYCKRFFQSQEEERFLYKEIKLQNTFYNHKIIRFQGFFQDNQFLYLVYQQTPFKRLKDLMIEQSDQTRLSSKVIIKQLLQCLQQLQSKQIIHNNIHPSSILLIKQRQNVSICLDNFRHAFNYIPIFQHSSLIVKHKVYGYSAPEIITSGHKVSYKSDVFSVGSILYRILFGKDIMANCDNKPWQQDNKVTTYAKINFDINVSHSIMPQSLDLLKKMLAFNPNERISAKDAIRHQYFNIHKRYSTFIKQQLNLKMPRRSTDYNLIIQKSQQKSYKKKRGGTKISRVRTKNLSKKLVLEGQIDQDELDDSHIDLCPKWSSFMTPSYEMKKNQQFKFLYF